MSEEEADWLAGHVYVLKFAIWFWGHVSTNNEYSIVGKWKHNFYAFNFTEKNNGCGDFFLKAQILCLLILKPLNSHVKKVLKGLKYVPFISLERKG